MAKAKSFIEVLNFVILFLDRPWPAVAFLRGSFFEIVFLRSFFRVAEGRQFGVEFGSNVDQPSKF